jgi:elongation factor Ts
MAAITAADVNKLRQMTGLGMMDCKKALTEAEGDFEVAVEILRKQGQKIAAKRADNATAEGRVMVELSSNHRNGKLLAFACETEPVSNLDVFKDLAAEVMAAAVKNDAATKEDILAAITAEGNTFDEKITETMGKIGEKLVIVDYAEMSGDKIVTYIHSNSKVGVMVAFEDTDGADVDTIGKQIAMQIAAMKPVALDKDDVDPKVIQKEIEIGMEQARQEGKPEAMLEKIGLGRLNKFYKENTLLNQEFIMDGSKTVAQVLQATKAGLKIKGFKRFQIG